MAKAIFISSARKAQQAGEKSSDSDKLQDPKFFSMEAYKKVYEFAQILEEGLKSDAEIWNGVLDMCDTYLEPFVHAYPFKHLLGRRELTEDEMEAEKLAKLVFISSVRKARAERHDFAIHLTYQIADKIEETLRSDPELWNRVLGFNDTELRHFMSKYPLKLILNRLPTSQEEKAGQMAKAIFVSSARKAQQAGEESSDSDDDINSEQNTPCSSKYLGYFFNWFGKFKKD